MLIYKITNKLNNKIYIGQTIRTLEKRKQQHIQRAKKGLNTKLAQALREYGEDMFEFEVLCYASSRKELNRLERFYISEYNSIQNGYNMIAGGSVNIMHDPEVRQHHLNVVRSDSNRAKISQTMKQYRAEHPFTTTTKLKLSQAAKGNTNGIGNPSHSKACMCVDILTGVEHYFGSYKDAGIWWYKTYKPFGETYSQATYQRKIIDCISKGKCRFRKGSLNIDIDTSIIVWRDYRKP